MKLKSFLLTGLMLAHAWSVPLHAQEPSSLTTTKEKVSYSIGADMARNLKRMEIDFDLDTLVRGIKDVLSDGKLLLSDEEIRNTKNALQNEIRVKQLEAYKAAGEENRKAGEAFLAENKTKEGVVTLPSGLQYKVLKAGDGKTPSDADTVECHYRGTLLDGTEFDSSYSRGQPATFKVAAVIKGWTEALKLMPVGSKWQLFIPSDLAYGERGAGQKIGPHATLIFEVELLGIK